MSTCVGCVIPESCQVAVEKRLALEPPPDAVVGGPPVDGRADGRRWLSGAHRGGGQFVEPVDAQLVRQAEQAEADPEGETAAVHIGEDRAGRGVSENIPAARWPFGCGSRPAQDRRGSTTGTIDQRQSPLSVKAAQSSGARRAPVASAGAPTPRTSPGLSSAQSCAVRSDSSGDIFRWR